MSTRPLTDQQDTVLTFITRFVQEHGFPPTLREIGDAIGLANVNAVRVADLPKCRREARIGMLARLSGRCSSFRPCRPFLFGVVTDGTLRRVTGITAPSTAQSSKPPPTAAFPQRAGRSAS